LVATPFDDAEEVIKVANDTRYGLAANIWTRDLSRAHLTAQKLQAGTVWINTHGMNDPSAPFGGVKDPAGAVKWARKACWPIPRRKPLRPCWAIDAEGPGIHIRMPGPLPFYMLG
jgi:hypothetical protein